jgi:hypothetical protein
MSDPYASFAAPVASDPYADVATTARPARKRRKTGIPEAAALAVANAATLGAGSGIAARNEAISKALQRGDFADAAKKAAGYLTAPGRAILNVAGLPQFAQDYSGDPEMAGRRQEFQQTFRQAGEDRPLTTFAASAAVPMLGARSAGMTLGQRALEGAKVGGLFGGAYGYNMAAPGQEQTGALSGLAGGAALGAAAPVAIQAATAPVMAAGRGLADAALRSPTVRGALNAIDDEIYRRPASGLGNQVNMAVVPPIPPRSRPGRATPRFVAPDDAARRAARLADRAGITAQELAQRIEIAQSNPRGLTMAEMFGQPGVQSAATLARMPGQTGELAQRQLGERNLASGQRLLDELSGQPGGNAVEILGERVRATAARVLRPLFGQRDVNAPLAQSQAVLDDLMQRPSIADAMPMARRSIMELIQKRELPPSALEDPAYLLHYAKIAINRMARDPTTVPAGQARMDNSFLIGAQQDITNALERIRPGYSQAMDELARVIRPREIAEDITNLRGVAPNVGNRLLADPETRRQLGRPGLENFGQSLQTEAEMFANASRMMPTTGSQTAPLMFGAADEMMMGTQAVPTNLSGAISAALDYFRQGINETVRNDRGRFLLRVVDDPTNGLSPQERQAIMNELSRIARERAFQTTATRGTARGAAASMQGSEQ